mmetsp:Transcript_25614/g.42115  ORF Transcript_25614/g.42115 Transcript_25614/m.42115 type:complete len:126 (+) Transcript_25614:707-1084(+)
MPLAGAKQLRISSALPVVSGPPTDFNFTVLNRLRAEAVLRSFQLRVDANDMSDISLGVSSMIVPDSDGTLLCARGGVGGLAGTAGAHIDSVASSATLWRLDSSSPGVLIDVPVPLTGGSFSLAGF